MKKEINRLLNEYGKQAVLVLKREVKIDRTVASGRTVNSINYKVTGNTVDISYDSTLGILDAGISLKNKGPSTYSILQWMRDKNIRPRDSRKSGSAKGRFVSTSRRNLISSAFLIARAIRDNGTIKRFGYRGTQVLDNIGNKSLVMRKLEEDISQVIDKEVNIIYEQL